MEAQTSVVGSKIEVLAADSPHLSFFLAPQPREIGIQSSAPISRASPSDLAMLISECFWVSQRSEEGRAIRGEIILGDPDPWDVKMGGALVFAAPLPLDRELLVRLLTASPHRSIGAKIGKQGLEVWGFAASYPDGVRVRIVGPGSVVASVAWGHALIVGNGRVLPSEHSPLYEVLFNAFVAQSPDERNEVVEYLRALDAHRHGGGLLFVPDNTWERDVSIPFRLDPKSTGFPKAALERMVQAREEDRKQRPEGVLNRLLAPPTEAEYAHFRHRERVAENRRLIAGWTAIDGFTVLTNDLNVLGFGAKVHAEGEPAVTFRRSALDGSLTAAKLSDLGGTRHQSAARYVAAHADCAAFTSSADGRLTAFVYEAEHEGLVVTTDLQYFL